MVSLLLHLLHHPLQLLRCLRQMARRKALTLLLSLKQPSSHCYHLRQAFLLLWCRKQRATILLLQFNRRKHQPSHAFHTSGPSCVSPVPLSTTSLRDVFLSRDLPIGDSPFSTLLSTYLHCSYLKPVLNTFSRASTTKNRNEGTFSNSRYTIS